MPPGFNAAYAADAYAKFSVLSVWEDFSLKLDAETGMAESSIPKLDLHSITERPGALWLPFR